jgi:hypothetical protein
MTGLDIANVVAYGSGGDAASVAVADANGDGKPDLLVANANGCYADGEICPYGSVSVLLGNGDGTFQNAVTYDSGGYDAESVAVADVNGDGVPDLIVANECGASEFCYAGAVGILLGNGDGTFQTAVSYLSGGYAAVSVAVADVNGDGKLDLLAVNSEGSVGVLLGNGNGTFQSAITYGTGGYGAGSVSIADVNGDGHLDLVVANLCLNEDPNGACNGLGEVGLLLGNGDGTFQSPTIFSSGAYFAFSVAIADVNGDGHLDLVVANACSMDPQGVGCATSGQVSVLLGNGNGTFGSAVTYNSGGIFATSDAVADVNGDGKPDIIVSNECSVPQIACTNTGTVSVLLGNGDGTFQSGVTYSSGGFEALGIDAYDVNGDGRPDILVANGCNALDLDPSACNVPGIDASSSVGVFLAVAPGAKTSTTNIATNLNPWTYGQALTLSANVTPPSGGTATGTVAFYDGWIALGSANLSNNSASLSGIVPTIGWHLFTARYSGDDEVPASSSAPLTETANQATTATALASSANPSYVTQTVTYTATVGGQFGGQITGTVTFMQGKTKLAFVTVANGQAAWSTTYTTTGTRKITAYYSGDANNQSNISAVLKQDVKALPAVTKTTLTTSGSPSLVNQPVKFTATVASTLPIPDGEAVTFYSGKMEIGTGTTTDGVATLTSSFSTAGTYAIKASYPGDAFHKASSGMVKQVVDNTLW